MKLDVNKLAKQIVTEATTSDEQINALVEDAIHESLILISLETLSNNFEQAKGMYYNNLRDYLAQRLRVTPSQVGKFITSEMHEKFANALQRAYEALQSTEGKPKVFTDPKFLLES